MVSVPSLSNYKDVNFSVGREIIMGSGGSGGGGGGLDWLGGCEVK